MHNEAFEQYKNLMAPKLPQTDIPTITLVNNQGEAIVNANILVSEKGQQLTVKESSKAGVYIFNLEDDSVIHLCLIHINARGYLTESRLFSMVKTTSIRIILGSENDLYLPVGSDLLPVTQYNEFLECIHKKEFEGQTAKAYGTELQERLFRYKRLYDLEAIGPITTENPYRMNQPNPGKSINGFQVPRNAVQRNAFLKELEQDDTLYPIALYVLWSDEPNRFSCINGKRVTFSFPDETDEGLIRKILSAGSFEIKGTTPASHRLYNPTDKLVVAEFTKILSNDMIRSASNVVLEGIAFSYTLNWLTKAE
ncbi:MAG: hypothetical protein ABI760_22245 [Ferruginibacter sp.]